MSMFNELVIKNDSVKKTPVFVFIDRVHLAHDQVLLIESKIFPQKVFSDFVLTAMENPWKIFSCGSKPETTAQKWFLKNGKYIHCSFYNMKS